MGEHKQCRIILSLLMGLILLAFCLPICAFAETSELSDGDKKGISLSATVPPSIISGAGAVYEKGGTSGLPFTTDDATGNLLRVLVDGKVVSPENYTVSGEPLAVTLNARYLDTLSAGEHTIEIVTVNGTARARFTVKAKSGGGTHGESGGTTDHSPQSPATGDTSNLELWEWLMCLSGVLLLTTIVTNIKRKTKR